MTILICGAALIGWYLLSELLAWVLCVATATPLEQYDSATVLTIRMGIFLLPVILPMVALALLTWAVLEIAHRISSGRTPPPADNPMEYVP